MNIARFLVPALVAGAYVGPLTQHRDPSDVSGVPAAKCAPGTVPIVFHLEPLETNPDLKSLGFKGATGIRTPDNVSNVRFDICSTPQGKLVLEQIVTGTNGPRYSTHGAEINGLQEAFELDQIVGLNVTLLAGGIVPYYQVRGASDGTKTFLAASRIVRSPQGEVTSTEGGWMVGTLESGDPYPPADSSGCRPFEGEDEIVEELVVGTATIKALVCLKDRITGESVVRARRVEIQDDNEALPAAARGRRIFEGELAADLLKGGTGHHGCWSTRIYSLPEVTYKIRYEDNERKIYRTVKYGSAPESIVTEPFPEDAPHNPC